jgi:hypothetical protein
VVAWEWARILIERIIKIVVLGFESGQDEQRERERERKKYIQSDQPA